MPDFVSFARSYVVRQDLSIFLLVAASRSPMAMSVTSPSAAHRHREPNIAAALLCSPVKARCAAVHASAGRRVGEVNPA